MQDFQALTVKYSAKTNVLLTDNVGISQAFDPKTTPQNQFPIVKMRAIWDTGASCTFISKEFANKIGLIPTGKNNVTGVNNTTLENTYQVNIYLPNNVNISFLKVVEVPALEGGAGVLIGMDIIGFGDFSVFNEDGKTVMSFRIPSIGGQDFVKLADNIRSNRDVLQSIEKRQENKKYINKKEWAKRKQKRKLKRKQKRKKK